MAKKRKKVEYRWFIWQHQTHLLGGIVAPDAETAFYGLSADERIWMDQHPEARLIRVKMEYPAQGKEGAQ